MRPTGERASCSAKSEGAVAAHTTGGRGGKGRGGSLRSTDRTTDPSSSSPFAEISFCHFYVFRSGGGAEDSARRREFLGGGPLISVGRDERTFHGQVIRKIERSSIKMCALLLWFLWGSSDAFSIFIHIHPKELREGGEARLVLDPGAESVRWHGVLGAPVDGSHMVW